ncbi:GNAT family N-acetyltransferase [Luteimonas vadosa]|uniref:GNAT family N-acetyltransferase n=1 Tax=Luteimonas vadosa TaxID=1165507 RepID=A0ABP9E4M3_9GAMM
MAPLERRLFDAIEQIPPDRWDALHDGGNPFVHHAFLAGLERHGCLRDEWGWRARHLTLWRDGNLVAAAPGYLKSNSHGEFFFDHAWAHAYARHGREYFPKWLCAVPYSPVTGPRLLAACESDKVALVDAIAGLTDDHGLSSAHVNFHRASESGEFESAAASDGARLPAQAGAPPGWLERIDVQYHWGNDHGWKDFDDFLAAMDHKHRKNIRQERARIARLGVQLRTVHGDEASDRDLAAMHAFYLRTFAEYGNSPALTIDFFRHLATQMPRSLVLVLCEAAGATIAGALFLRGRDTLYGRYWGAVASPPGLHFEACYYQGIEYCLREGLGRFEPGAQGEHKIARGFLPSIVHSHHWIADPAFRQAIGAWCTEEAASVRRHAQALAARTPFRTPPEPLP